jgi:hypothetical protein
VNAAIAMRTRDEDVREWQSHGIEGWSTDHLRRTDIDGSIQANEEFP